MGSSLLGPVARSRWVRHRHLVPSPAQGLEPFVSAVKDAIDTVGYDIVFGGGDAEVMALAATREAYGAKVPYPDAEIANRAFDKLASLDAAVASGLRVPATWPCTAATIAAVLGPVMLKAPLHWTPGSEVSSTRVEPAIVRSPAEARLRANAMRAAGAEPFFQELIPGGYKISYIALVAPSGEVWAEHQQWTRRTWPPASGHDTRGETMPVDRALADRSVDFLRRLGWFGLSHLEFLVPVDGEPRLVDFQGRFYGSLALAMRAGVDYPGLWARAILDGWPAEARPEPPITARTSVRYIRSQSDLMRAFAERRGGIAAELMGYARYRAGAVGSLWSMRDPAPAGYWMLNVGRVLGGRLVRRLSRPGPVT